ncbi:AAA-domain-containing protein [Exidia glandulosa HHB12029]|uniref:AAA-domain-containing protein n=1 Tax=Exidia glandulosa HHB12029 TaxID=1314781 RepID=A0A165MXM1_EXIGL|nr:AAA-domain-containing protein [Exidia glandulosa HHB12029]
MSNTKPHPKPLLARKSDLEDGPRVARRVLVHADVLKSMRVFAGDVLKLTTTKPGDTSFALGTAWPSLELEPDCLQLSSSLMRTLDLQGHAQAQVVITSGSTWATNAKAAASVSLREVDPPPRPKDDKKKDKDKGRDWLALQLRETLVDLKYITPTQAVVVQHGGVERTFVVHTASSSTSAPDVDVASLASKMDALSVSARKDVWTVSWDTLVHIVDLKPPPTPLPPAPDSDAYTSVGGLDAQIRAVRDLIDIPLLHPERFLAFNLPPPRGVLLFGPPGTGKTHLARAIAKSAGAGVLVVNGPELVGMYHGQTEERLRGVFEEARRKGRCVVVLDEVDALCPRRDGGDGGEAERRAVATLLTLMDGMDQDQDGAGARVVVVATTNRPNAIDPALRRPGRFDREIEIGVPDAPARLQILQVLLSKTPHTLSLSYLTSLSLTLHGFVGADLASLIRSAGTLAIQRSSPTLDTPDIALALPSIRPSALREVEIQSQRSGSWSWDDVGGMQSVRRALEQAVVWPLRHRAAFERLGVRGGARGVLMYGPPGCSKTLVARALAAEGGVNFIAVRGAELLNKYVGESERAVRDVFRKARAASPCVIFFDELDALGTARDDERAKAHVGVLTTLLNEMDGIGSAVGVTVVAATNRPQVIDPALLRPGRLDRVLFVGPPDASARVEILKVHTRTLTVDRALDLNLLASMTEGCSGAEIAAMCQDAAMRAMARDIDTPFIAQEDFVDAARGVRRAVTRKMLDEYEEWQRTSGMPAV